MAGKDQREYPIGDRECIIELYRFEDQIRRRICRVGVRVRPDLTLISGAIRNMPGSKYQEDTAYLDEHQNVLT